MGGQSSKTASVEHLERPADEDDPIKYGAVPEGLIKNRSCTDVLCCILFALFVIAFLCIGIYAFAMGDPRYLLYPADSYGDVCGLGKHKDRPYLFFFDLVECFLGPDKAKLDIRHILAFGCRTPQICVSKCPESAWTYAPGSMTTIVSHFGKIPFDTNATNAICKYGFTPTEHNIRSLIDNETCAPYYVPTDAILDRCIPSLMVDGFNELSGKLFDKHKNEVNESDISSATKQLQKLLNLRDYGLKILGDVTASWWLILIFIGIAAVVSLIWITLMRWLAGIILWLSIFLFAGFFIFAIYYCFDKYTYLKSGNATMPGTGISFVQYTTLDYYTNLSQTWLALGIIACIVLVIIIILLLFLRTRILTAIALIKEASRALMHMMSVLLWPLVPYILQSIVLAYWGASAICLAAASRGSYCSVSNDSYTNARCTTKNYIDQIVSCDENANGTAGSVCNFVRNGGEQYTLVLQAFQLFVWLWLMNFIIAFGQIVLAGAFASYYWAFNKPADIPTFPLASSVGRALRYHPGSLAFGALLIAIIQFIRIILEFLDHKLKGSESRVAKFFIKCLKCCFYCLDKFMKFINSNAYIMIAVYGKNFCTSAKHAFFLILRNCIRVFVIDKVADFLLFISKLFVVGAVGVLAYFFFTREIPGVRDVIPTPNLSYYLIPVIIIIVGTYVVASSFFNVYNVGVDTLFLCFLEDLERNDGSAEKPYYMNSELMKILGKKNLPIPLKVENK